MDNILQPILLPILSPAINALSSGGDSLPANVVLDRDGNAVVDRDGNYVVNDPQ